MASCTLHYILSYRALRMPALAAMYAHDDCFEKLFAVLIAKFIKLSFQYVVRYHDDEAVCASLTRVPRPLLFQYSIILYCLNDDIYFTTRQRHI